MRVRDRNCFVKREGLLSLCAADLAGLGSDPSSSGHREPRWNRAFGQLDNPPLNTTVDLPSYINFRYAHQTVAKPKSEHFLPAGWESAK